MLKITIISVGGMKESYFAEAIAEYEKRASAYAELKNINLKEAPLDRVREGDIAAALDAEGEQILKNLPPRGDCRPRRASRGSALHSPARSRRASDRRRCSAREIRAAGRRARPCRADRVWR